MKRLSSTSPVRLLLTLPCSMVCSFLLVIIKSVIWNALDPSLSFYKALEQSEPLLTVWTLTLGFLLGFILIKGKTLTTYMEDRKTKDNAFTQGRMKINDFRYLLIGIYILIWVVFVVLTIQLGAKLLHIYG